VSPIVREYFRVPRRDRSTYFRPSPGQWPALLDANRRLLASYDFEVAGRPFAAFRADARAEILSLARRSTEDAGFAAADWSEPQPVVFVGHQPVPFHPGVWIKNFLAGALAQHAGGVCVNMEVDNDAVGDQAVRFPVRTGAAAVRAEDVPLVSGPAGVPFEEQPASALRREAGDEVLARLPEPCRGPFRRAWAYVVEAADGSATVGEACTRARRRLEAEQGLANLEIPVSHMADSRAFLELAAALLARRESLLAAYNGALAEYRRVYRERSDAQPLPDLARNGQRIEMPYWLWRAGRPRRRLWTHGRPGGDLVLEADDEPVAVIPAAEADDAPAVADRLSALRQAGWKVRPRAVALTLFAHLCVGDVFVHGVGGALYDKVTESVVERLLGVRPPGVALATCTVHLPLETYPATEADWQAAHRAVRDWRFNPDRMLRPEILARPEARALVEEKWRLIRDPPAAADGRRQAYHRVHAINERLSAMGPDGPAEAVRRKQRLERELEWNAVLTDREYPFWLYDAAALAAFYREAGGLRAW